MASEQTQEYDDALVAVLEAGIEHDATHGRFVDPGGGRHLARRARVVEVDEDVAEIEIEERAARGHRGRKRGGADRAFQAADSMPHARRAKAG